MVQHWSPMSELRRTPNRGEWIMFDGATRVAVFRALIIGRKKERMIRVVTWAEKSEDRVLVGYFPHLDIAAEVTWAEWTRASTGMRVPPLLDVD